MSGRIAPLGELCDMDRRGVRPDDPLASCLPFVGVENVGSGTGFLNFDTKSRLGSQRSASFRFDSRHVLYAKLRPYLNKVATPDFAGRCSTELVPLLPRAGVDRAFLAHLLRREETVAFVMASATGARMPRADMRVLLSMPVSVPPLHEQRRVAGILDRAARIECLHARAADRLNDFTLALFVRMFGDPTNNRMGWPVYPLIELLQDQTKCVKKIQKKNYKESGEVPIIDQGVTHIAGYTNEIGGQFNGASPVIIFGDHTRRFKLVRSPFFLGADGAKLLIPKHKNIDPTFLYAHLKCLVIEDAGYSRHFRFLKQKYLMLPPFEQQLKFRTIFGISERLIMSTESASVVVSVLMKSLMDRLLRDGQ